MAQRKLVMSAVIPALDSVSDAQLLAWIKIVVDELMDIEERFFTVASELTDGNQDLRAIATPTLQVGEYQIQATEWKDD